MVYSLLNVRSPAPPLVALVGLLGILVGEQIIPVGKHVLAGSALAGACREARCAAHVFGMLPGRHQDIAVTKRARRGESTVNVADMKFSIAVSFTTLDRFNPTASAVAIRNHGIFTAVGNDNETMKLRGPSTRVIDLRGRRVLPGLIDNHLHIIRGGLNFNMELRWDGVRSLADALTMLKKQVSITPPPQWVRAGGWLYRAYRVRGGEASPDHR